MPKRKGVTKENLIQNKISNLLTECKEVYDLIKDIDIPDKDYKSSRSKSTLKTISEHFSDAKINIDDFKKLTEIGNILKQFVNNGRKIYEKYYN